MKPFRLTFDEDGEPVLVPDEENQERVQRLTLDQDKEWCSCHSEQIDLLQNI